MERGTATEDMHAPGRPTDSTEAEHQAGAINPKLAARLLPTLNSALERNCVTFDHFVLAWFGSRRRFGSPPQTVEAYYYYLPGLLRAFQCEYGDVMYLYLGRKTINAVVMTRKRPRLFRWQLPWPARWDMAAIVNESDPPAVVSFTYELDRLLIEARRLLGKRQRYIVYEKLYSVYASVIEALDYFQLSDADAKALLTTDKRGATRSSAAIEWRNSRKNDIAQKVAVLRTLVNETSVSVTRAAGRKSQAHYFSGMLLGLGLLALASPLTQWLLSRAPSSGLDPITAVGCLIIGGIGATLSVMWRVTSGKLVIDYEAGKVVMTVVGVFRALLGGFFAFVLYLILASGLVSIASPARGKESLFYWSLAVLAGFSERLVPDVLGSTERRLTSRSSGASHEVGDIESQNRQRLGHG
jgi:hypothetical protein